MIIDIERTIEELKTQARQDEAFVESGAMPEFDQMLEVLRTMHLELHLDVPNIDTLKGLMAEALTHHNRIFREAIKDFNQGRLTKVFGGPDTMAKIRSVFDSLAGKIVQLANQRTDEFNRLAAAAKAAAETVDTPRPPKDDTDMTDLTRQEVDAKLAANKAEVDARLANFDASIRTGFAELRADMAKMRGDFEKQSHDSTKWIIGSVFGMISLAVAVIGVLINLSKTDKPASAPAAQLAPIVITVPGATPTAAPNTPPK
jgi:hypothetical protein